MNKVKRIERKKYSTTCRLEQFRFNKTKRIMNTSLITLKLDLT